MTPVTPGQPLLPALTAEWYNNTLKSSPEKRQRGLVNNSHQQILTGNYTGSGGITRFQAKGIDSLLIDDDITLSCTITDTVDEYNWVVALNTGEFVYSGITLADVTIINTDHRYITYRNNRLESACFGKAMFLYQESSGNSLIDIGPRIPLQGVAYVPTIIPARSSGTCGSASGTVCHLSPGGTLSDTTQTITIYNTMNSDANGGYVQFKEFCGIPVVDTAPCSDTIETKLS